MRIGFSKCGVGRYREVFRVVGRLGRGDLEFWECLWGVMGYYLVIGV